MYTAPAMAKRTRIPFTSSLLAGDAFAEQAGGPEHEHEDEDRERDHVLPLVSHACGADVLDEPKSQASQQRAPDVADPTEHGRDERLDARDEPDVEARPEAP